MSDDVGDPTRKRVDLLRRVLDRDEIRIVFQPIFDVESKTPHGYEAFARGPQHSGLEDYGSLYRAASEADLSAPLDRACRRAALIAGARIPTDCLLFVKMAPMSIADETFVGKDAESLFDGNLVPAQVVWLLSEQDPVASLSQLRDRLSDLEKLEYKVGIDNMGRGYSGLDKLVHTRPHYVKIAPELVRDLHDSRVKRQLLSTFRELARKIEAHLIVSGIESMQELEVVRSVGIDLVQGNLLAEPSGAFQATTSLDAWSQP